MSPYELTDQEFWVLHTPYPDRTWRGLEKCIELVLDAELQPKRLSCEATGADYCVPLLFSEREGADAFIAKHGLVGAVPVRVLLVAPFVRQPLDAVPDRVVP